MGLTSIAGHAQTVRPLVAPMAEAAARPKASRERARRGQGDGRGTDNVGLFFGEDIFIAIGSILLIQGLLERTGSSCSRWNCRSGRSRPRLPPSRSTPLQPRPAAWGGRRQ
jgi:uncharacterized membrane protein